MARGTNSKPITAFDTFNEVTSNETRKKKDFLYLMVKMIGPSKVGKLINSNSDTIWSRVEKPGQFRYEEMLSFTKALGVSIGEFGQILDNQAEHNKTELKHHRPIGRERFQLERGGVIKKKTKRAGNSPAKNTSESRTKKSS
jgi:hypothetical protein